MTSSMAPLTLALVCLSRSFLFLNSFTASVTLTPLEGEEKSRREGEGGGINFTPRDGARSGARPKIHPLSDNDVNVSPLLEGILQSALVRIVLA